MATAALHDLHQPLLERALREWRRRGSLRALLAGLALALTAAATLVLLDQAVSLPAVVRATMRFLPALILLGALIRALARARSRPDRHRLALLIEEQRPELGYRLATLVGLRPAAESGSADRESATSVITRAFERTALAALSSLQGPFVPLALGRHAVWAAAVVALSFSLMLLVPGGLAELSARWVTLASGPSSGVSTLASEPIGRTAAAAGGAFRDVRVRVEPPAYTRAASYELGVDSLSSAPVGSRVRVEGAAPARATRLEARVIGGTHPVAPLDEKRFSFQWTLGAEDRGVELVALGSDGVLARRVIALAARADASPSVELLSPARDLVLATASGSVSLRATARDDYGVRSFALEWILTRGSGESFSSTDGGAGWQTESVEGSARAGSYQLDVAALGMAPGDVLHVRAVAEDGNTVSGPGRGVSRTGVIRIALADQQDQANTLIGFPIEPEGDPVLTQRMIVLLTERLVERATTLTREGLRAESEEIARAQARVRERFADMVYARTSGTGGAADPDAHDHDADPALAVNRLLVPALDAMFEAEGHLHLSEAAAALPAEYRALEIVQSARESERVFARGVQTVAPIDVVAARGMGSIRDVNPAARSPGRAAPSADRYLALLTTLSVLLRDRSPGAALEVSALAAELLADVAVDAQAGALLARAANDAQEGRVDEAITSLAHVRALLAPPTGGSRRSPEIASSAAGSAYLSALTAGTEREAIGVTRPARPAPPSNAQPFVFATARYASGDWDSAPLVPSNLIHSLALYTDIPVLPDGVVVDLASRELFRFPFVFLTGHLPVQLTSAESENVREYVDRGGFLFIDDHNHDIDGAFHRTVTAELARVFGEDALVALPEEHELYRTFFVFEDGPPTTSHELNGWGDGLVHEQLFAIERNGRIGVLYSNKDYASEWSYHAANKRFLGLDNTRFGVNVILHALTR